MTNAAKLSLIAETIGSGALSKQASHEKSAAGVLRGLGAAAKWGGKFITGGAGKALGKGLQYAAKGPSFVPKTTGFFRKAIAPMRTALADGGFAAGARLERAGAGLQSRLGGLRSAMATAYRGTPRPPVSSSAIDPAAQYSRGLRFINRKMDDWAMRPNGATGALGGFARRRIRGAAGWIVPKTWMGGAHSMLTFGLMGDRYNHAQRVQQAGDIGAAGMLDYQRKNVLQGLGMMTMPLDNVSQQIAQKGYGGVAQQPHNFGRIPGYEGAVRRQTATGALIPGYSKLMQQFQ